MDRIELWAIILGLVLGMALIIGPPETVEKPCEGQTHYHLKVR